ncbi:MAG: hypothetical protein CMM01_12765 [Rhodopirellula sp.]|nr:hypothetical protein [Rhodopirellula sp.]
MVNFDEPRIVTAMCQRLQGMNPSPKDVAGMALHRTSTPIIEKEETVIACTLDDSNQRPYHTDAISTPR